MQIEWPEVGEMNVELLKMGLLLLVGFLFGGYHFDDQVLISERLSGHHRVKLKNTRVLKVFLFLRDKNQRSYFRRSPFACRFTHIFWESRTFFWQP